MSGAFERLGASQTPVQKTGMDKIFGAGSDGNVTISSNTSISRDMYYNNLTVNSGITLFTNGFKIFVKESLVNNGTIGMPTGTAQTTSVMAGSSMTRIDGNAEYVSSDAISGTLTIAEVRDFDALMLGIIQKGANPRRWFSGAAGSSGAAGTANPGGGGNANPGTAGSGGSAGLGGGGVVVLAKSISGTGVFVSEGTAGTSGTSGAAGNSESGNPGHNPGGHASAHNPGGHAQGHNPVGHASSHTPGNHVAAHHQAPQATFNKFGQKTGHHPGHHNPGHENPGTTNHHSHPGNPFHHSHPGNPFHHSHPGNPFHNPSYSGGNANPGNPGNPGNQGFLAVLSRGVSTHIASSSLTYVEDLDD